MTRVRYALAVAGCALLVIPAAAAARPGQRGFYRTYPVASRLCVTVANGRGPLKLRGDVAQVSALCATLSGAFTGAQVAYFAGVNPLRRQAIALVRATRTTCLTMPHPVCRQARAAARVTLKGLRTQVAQLAVIYRGSIQAARTAFWNAIHALRGARTISADAGRPVAPMVTIPSKAS